MTVEDRRFQPARNSDSFDRATPVGYDKVTSSQPGSRPGRVPATSEQVRAAEARLGVPLPPSLWAFLLVSNGCGPVSQYTEALRPCEEIDWFRRTHPAFVDSRRDTEDHDLFLHALCLTRGADAILLDTRTVSADGEYGAYLFAVKYGELDERYSSFDEVVLAGRSEIEWHREHCV
ncbi:SMI1/KNR4 family protein [Streptomyces sp. NPDC008313]|uniref:SMI1/KNR4 family protein n=1 Tax=Streptomyces sp. NPDC008313 TaxID=3364826 RepID=UPI0036EAE4BF